MKVLFCFLAIISIQAKELHFRDHHPVTLKVGNWFFTERSGHYKNINRVDEVCQQSKIIGQKIEFYDCPYSIHLVKENNRYRFEVNGIPQKLHGSLTFHFKKNKNEYYFGGGAQYSHLSLNNQKIEFISQEQGVGRGIQPISFFQELIRPGLSGNETVTYATSPIILTSSRTAFVFENDHYGTADFTKKDFFEVTFYHKNITLHYIKEKNWTELFKKTTAITGRMRPLPSWIQEGAIIGLMGGEKLVSERIKKIKDAGTSIAGVWLQDWVGKRETILGTRLKWDWQLEKSRYPHLQFGYPFLGYFNPYLTDIPKTQHRKSLLEEAKRNRYLVSVKGELYKSLQGGFHGYLVDLFNPKAYAWLKQQMKKAIVQYRFQGWMADFSENYPITSRGENHHRYIEKWIKLNREIVDELSPHELVFFNRASHLKVPKYSTLFWLGDQTSTWDKKDGLHSSLIGLLTSGLSGKVFNHSDIGGYVSIEFSPLVSIVRERELLQRWMELNAFSAIFRTHPGLNPELAHQVYDHKESLKSFAYWSKVFQSLKSYKQTLILQSSKEGIPFIRPLFINYPDDQNSFLIDDQFMLGKGLLIAPVLTAKTNSRSVYLPRGKWTHLWSGKTYLSQGERFSITAPLGHPPVFYSDLFPKETIRTIKSLKSEK